VSGVLSVSTAAEASPHLGSNLRYRTLGKTALEASELGFGCGSVRGLFVRGSRREMVRAAERAIMLGVNYFDTASAYGDGISELNLSGVLNELGAAVYVGTKVHLTPAEMNDIQRAVRRSVEGSPKRLSRESIDLSQLHDPIGLSGEPSLSRVGLAGLEQVTTALQSLRDEGKVRFYGINGLGETQALLQAVETAGAQTIQACYNLLNPSASQTVLPDFPFQDFGRLILRARSEDMEVIANQSLAGGALSGGRKRHPNAEKPVSPIASGKSYSDDVSLAKKFQFLVDEG